MSNRSDNKDKFSPINKIPSAESILIGHGNITSNYEEYTPKLLPPSMREIMTQNTTKLLRRIRSQLREFTKFVEDMQRKTPSEYQLFAGSPSPEAPKPTEAIRPVQPVDPRPKNAPLRDAFQMMRNLLWRISNVIDQVAADIPAEDDRRRDVQSPHFDYYYAQYVFQLSLYILQTVGEELEQFSKVLAEVSADDALSKLPPRVDEVDANFSSHKICPERSEIFHNYGASLRNSDTSCEESSSTSDGSLPKVELKKRAVDALELLMFLSEKMYHYFQDKGFPEFDELQQLEFSRRALGIPDLCKNCSKKVARQLRRYSSRENLYAEKYEKSSDESLFSSQRGKDRHAHFNGFTRESYFKSDSKPTDIQTATKSRTHSDPKWNQISDTAMKMTYQKRSGPFKREEEKGRETTNIYFNLSTDNILIMAEHSAAVFRMVLSSEFSVFTDELDCGDFGKEELSDCGAGREMACFEIE
ncbi:hypothetical protein AVEN_130387-1 [Araneus ventricosus]|uniref:Uncharacterized protein n=1 Tax=Araneus ventricosus TaxID=182803 RepID=A0A4Y2BFG9_ARAVE|nr:hypothetical protein AVEN_130387-1 [Araneus ventricosus]